ncbi:MAG: ABC transporter ATP-binding protein [Bacteroidota bacterium]
MLRAQGLKHQYQNGPSLEFPDLICEPGDQWLLLGESGSGKTTMLHLLAGLIRSQTGSININGTELSQLSENQLDRFRGQTIGLVFQKAHLIRALSVMENILAASFFAGVKSNPKRAQNLLDRLNIGDKAQSKVFQLSQGEQQRVAIARALINNPALILADEPTSALDDQNTEEVIQLLENQARAEGASLIIVTHDQRLKTRFDHQLILTKASRSKSIGA